MKTVDFTGTVSRATMRPQDVLPSIMDVLFEYHPDAYQEITSLISTLLDATYSELCGDEYSQLWQTETMSWILYEVAWNAMDEIAPGDHYFGAHPGDGCDYGFWQYEDDEEAVCFCCGSGLHALVPCPGCDEPLCGNCLPPHGAHICEIE